MPTQNAVMMFLMPRTLRADAFNHKLPYTIGIPFADVVSSFKGPRGYRTVDESTTVADP